MGNNYEKIPPQSVEVEMSLLGSVLSSEECLDEMMSSVTCEYFYSRQNRSVFSCIKDLYSRDKTVDLVVLSEQMRVKSVFDSVGGETYLSKLVTSVSTSSSVGHYIEILRDKMRLRRLIKETSLVCEKAYLPDAVASDLIDSAESSIFSIAEDMNNTNAVPMSDLMGDVFRRIETMSDSGGITGIQSGFRDLDKCTTGFHPGELIIVAARPGMGKTAFCLSLAANSALRSNCPRPIALFSLEMPKEQLVQRMLCSEAEVDMHKMRGGYLGSEDLVRLSQAGGLLHQSPIWIDDTPAISPMEVRAKCRRIKSQVGDLGLVIIDYLQLMRASERTNSRQEEVGSISRTLKEISKELNVPVIALAQLSRATEQGGSTRPQLSHLRESGSIEQDADIVLFVHRESYYMHKDDEGYEEACRVGEIIVGKQRNGPLEDIPISWQGQYTRFMDLDVNRYEKEPF